MRRAMLLLLLCVTMVGCGSDRSNDWRPPEADFITGTVTTPWGETVAFEVQNGGVLAIDRDSGTFFGIQMSTQDERVIVRSGHYRNDVLTPHAYVTEGGAIETSSNLVGTLGSEVLRPSDALTIRSTEGDFRVALTGLKRQTKAFDKEPTLLNRAGDGMGCIRCSNGSAYCAQMIDAPCGKVTVHHIWINPEDLVRMRVPTETKVPKGPDGEPDPP